ncbi:unnamed protein product [Pleuronectes platessa]|uniref:Uncharacterized protein n=1 Tax=Pleuronectes platessa TaxID=8262 RepID=A0A9N7U6Q2_PLEPL|nr:unnamed protein product [Pleuronectes platessa]
MFLLMNDRTWVIELVLLAQCQVDRINPGIVSAAAEEVVCGSLNRGENIPAPPSSSSSSPPPPPPSHHIVQTHHVNSCQQHVRVCVSHFNPVTSSPLKPPIPPPLSPSTPCPIHPSISASLSPPCTPSQCKHSSALRGQSTDE